MTTTCQHMILSSSSIGSVWLRTLCESIQRVAFLQNLMFLQEGIYTWFPPREVNLHKYLHDPTCLTVICIWEVQKGRKRIFKWCSASCSTGWRRLRQSLTNSLCTQTAWIHNPRGWSPSLGWALCYLGFATQRTRFSQCTFPFFHFFVVESRSKIYFQNVKSSKSRLDDRSTAKKYSSP